MTTLSVLLPSMYRYKLLKRCIESLYETTKDHTVECIVAIDEDEDSYNLVCDFQYTYPSNFNIIPNFSLEKRGALKAWNDTLKLSNPKYKYLLPAGDDQLFHPNWLEYALDAHTNKLNGYGLVGLNDLAYDGNIQVATMMFFDRKFCIDVLGGVICYPHYHYYCQDLEINDRAKNVNKFYWEKRSVIEHLHPAHGKRELDILDKEKMDAGWMEQDNIIYNQRKLLGFPNDFEKVITE